MGTCLEQVLAGFEQQGEDFDVSRIRLRSEELRRAFGMDETQEAKQGQAHHQSHETRDVLSSWAAVGKALPPGKDELGIPRRRKSRPASARSSMRPGSAMQHGADEPSRGMESLYRGGQEEDQLRKGRRKKTTTARHTSGQRNTSTAASGDEEAPQLDLYRGGTFDYVQQKRRPDSSNSMRAPFKVKTDPWGDVTDDDKAAERASNLAQRAQQRRQQEPADIFRGDDPFAISAIPHKRRSRPGTASATGATANILAYGTGVGSTNVGEQEERQQRRRLRKPAGTQPAKTDPWGSTETTPLAQRKK